MRNNRNANILRAKQSKNDEYYTLYEDIAEEVRAHTQHNPDVFRGKTIFCPCDDPDRSNFTKYFMDNFESLGLKRLISTCMVTVGRGKLLIRDSSGVERRLLQNSGDFRTEEIRGYRDEADVIITNPPFSLLRAFTRWIIEAKKEFLIVASVNTICSKSMFPFVRDGKAWLGYNHIKDFYTPYNGYKEVTSIGCCCWLTNLFVEPKPPMPLRTVQEIRGTPKLKSKLRGRYLMKYDNYDIAEVPTVRAIPSDYSEPMGVPVNFMYLYSPEQFELLGISRWDTRLNGVRIYRRVIIRKR